MTTVLFSYQNHCGFILLLVLAMSFEILNAKCSFACEQLVTIIAQHFILARIRFLSTFML